MSPANWSRRHLGKDRGTEHWRQRAGHLDCDTTKGAIDLVYALPNFRVEYVRVEPPGIPPSFWRSIGSSHNVFVTESFIDELAAQSQHQTTMMVSSRLASDAAMCRSRR